MKKNLFITVAFFMITVFGFTQSAKTTTDYYGNKTTTYSNPNGQNTGTAKTSTDYYGNQNTTYTSPFGSPKK